MYILLFHAKTALYCYFHFTFSQLDKLGKWSEFVLIFLRIREKSQGWVHRTERGSMCAHGLATLKGQIWVGKKNREKKDEKSDISVSKVSVFLCACVITGLTPWKELKGKKKSEKSLYPTLFRPQSFSAEDEWQNQNWRTEW